MSRRVSPDSGTIRGRLRLVSGAIGALLLVSGSVAWWTSQHLSANIRTTLASVREEADLSARFSAAISQEIEAARNYTVSGDPGAQADFRRLSTEAHTIQRRMNREVGETTREKTLIARIDQALSLAETHYARAHRLLDLGQLEPSRVEMRRADPAIRATLADLGELGALSAVKVAEVSEELQRRTVRQGWQVVLLLLGAILVAVVVSRLVTASIERAVDELVGQAGRLSDGDSTARTTPESHPGEFRTLAEAMNRAAVSLGELQRSEAALRQAEKLAAVGQLVSGVAHEFNNPLASILLESEISLEEAIEPPVRASLRTIRDQALRARRIVRDLLAFVQDRSAAAEPVSPYDMVAHVLRSVEERREQIGAELVNDIPRTLPRLWVDRMGIEQAVTNILLNAMLACGAGGRVELSGQLSDEGCELIIQDDGPGLPPDVLPRIFEPFFSTRAVGEGAGLGLSAALGIIQQHGGTVRAESRGLPGGRGARFVISLPLAPDTAEHAVPRELLASARSRRSGTTG